MGQAAAECRKAMGGADLYILLAVGAVIRSFIVSHLSVGVVGLQNSTWSMSQYFLMMSWWI